MPAPHSRASFLAATRRRAGHADLRISDAERAEVADLLAAHYGDGRLDQAEFEQRLDQAMRARTYGDLSGLFADLPPIPAAGAPEGPDLPTRLHQGRSPHRLLLIAAVIAIAVLAGHALTLPFTPWAWPFIGPWAWIGLIVLVVLLVTRARKGSS